VPGGRGRPAADRRAGKGHTFQRGADADIDLANRLVARAIESANSEGVRARHEVRGLVEECERRLAADVRGDPVDLQGDLREVVIVMGPGLDGGEAADDGSLGGTGEFQEGRCPVQRHGDLLARARDEVPSLHRLGDDSKPMTAFRPTLGGPWDQETAVLEAPHVRDPDAVDVEVHKWIGMPGPSMDLDGPSDRGAVRRLQNRDPARVEPRGPQHLRVGLAGNREFDGEGVRPRMLDLQTHPGLLANPVEGRRLDLNGSYV